MPGDAAYRAFSPFPSPSANGNDGSDNSDYGLDFTSEEEDLLSDILSEVPKPDHLDPEAAAIATDTITATFPTPTSSPPISISVSSPESFFSAQSALSLLHDDELVSILQASEALAEQVPGSASKDLPNVAYGDSAFPQ